MQAVLLASRYDRVVDERSAPGSIGPLRLRIFLGIARADPPSIGTGLGEEPRQLKRPRGRGAASHRPLTSCRRPQRTPVARRDVQQRPASADR